jgi:hypothetical protein
MAIDFPASPTNGQTFTSGALVYTYDGTKWTAQPAGVSGGTKIEVGNTKAEIVDTGSDGRFVVTTEGTERLRCDSSGRLLVGTATARSNFYNGPFENGPIQVEGTGFSNSGASLIHCSTTANWSSRLVFARGRGSSVGSNTLVASGDILGEVFFLGNDGTEFVEGAKITAEVDGTPGANDMPCRLVFSTTSDNASSPTERMRITNSGNIGIGTASPVSKLQVNTGDNAFVTIANNSSSGAGTELTGIEFKYGGGGATQHISRIVASEQSGGGGFLHFQTAPSASGAYTTKLQVNQDGTLRFNSYGAGTLSTSSNGTVSASDGRYKTKTRFIENAIDAISALQPTYYRWNEDSPFESDHEELGFIAQEVAAVIPEASPGEDEEGKYRNYHDRAIIAMLVKGIQEQQTMIAELQAKVVALEAQ